MTEKFWNKIVVGALLAMMAGFALIFFYRIQTAPLLDYDESIYAQVAREAIEQDGLGFDWKGNLGLGRESLWAEKPPLMLWLIQLGFVGLGVGELGARVWVAIFALATILMTFFFTKKLFKSDLTSLAAVGAYFIAFQYIESAAILQFDIPAGFFILLSVYLFYLGLENRKYLIWFGVSLALGVLTKNVVGLLPAVIAGIFTILTWNWSYFKSKEFWKGVGLFFLIVIPWHLIETLKFGKDFWNQYLFYHVLNRWQAPLEGNSGYFWFYYDMINKHTALFWLSVGGLVVSLVLAIRRKKNYLYLLVSTLAIFIFFSSSNTKLPAYILVLYPFLAIAAGVLVGGILEQVKKRSGMLSLAILALLIAYFAFLGFRFNSYKLTKQLTPYPIDSKAVGQYLFDNYRDLPVYYYSTIGTKPSIIFYSNRVINYLPYPSPKPTEHFILISEVLPGFDNSELIYSTNSQKVYEIK